MTKEIQEVMENCPSHYAKRDYDVTQIQEDIYWQTLHSLATESRGLTQSDALFSLWSSYATKHILRMGFKDDPRIEAHKARNYLNRALEGEWLGEK